MKSYNQFVAELNDLETQKANNAERRKQIHSNLKSAGQANNQHRDDVAARRQAEKDREDDREIIKKDVKKELGFREAYDKDIAGSSQIKKQGEGGRVGANRKKSEAETRRMKAVGGGKTAPVTYKDRKDIGSQRQTDTRQQQPTQERGSTEVKQSYADKVKAERRKAAQARIAAKKSGGEVKKDTTSSKDASKQATKLLSTKKTEKKPVNPNYKPAKASGMTRQERMKVTRKGETMLRGIMKDQETSKYKKETGTNPDAKGRTKIMGRVHKRMST
jgi:hypothetical protein